MKKEPEFFKHFEILLIAQELPKKTLFFIWIKSESISRVKSLFLWLHFRQKYSFRQKIFSKILHDQTLHAIIWYLRVEKRENTEVARRCCIKKSVLKNFANFPNFSEEQLFFRIP